MVLKLTVSIRVPFYSTEDKSKIESAIRNLLEFLPKLSEVKDNKIVFLTANEINVNSLKLFFNYVRQHEILDTVRRYARVNPLKGEVIFYIHKQALTMKKIAVVGKDTTSPLGNVELIIHTDNTEKLLDWLVPETSEGKIINPKKFKDIFNL